MSSNGDTRRINRGGGHRYLMDGYQVDGVTTVLGNGVPKPALVGWAANTTAAYAVDHWDELADVGVAERLKRLGKARFEDRDAAARAGTAVHGLALRLAAGEEVDVPEHLTGHVDAYLRFAAEWESAEQLAEVVVLNRRYRYMGTLDLITSLKDGSTWLLDWKTARSGVYPENALQLAAYRYAEAYLGINGEERPMPEVDRCGVVWLRADGYDLVPVEAGADAFRTFLYAQEIATWLQAPRDEVVGEALTP